MVQAIIFDCFGVLVGSGFEYTYRAAGGDPQRDRNFIKQTLEQENRGSITTAEFHKAIMDKLSISEQVWRRAVDQAERPNEELLTYIEQLHAKYKTAVLSNSNAGVVESIIGKQRLKQCFDELFVSAEIGMIKPEPEIYRYAADELGVEPSECVFIDDRETLLEPAARLGMHTIVYTGFPEIKAKLKQLLANPEG